MQIGSNRRTLIRQAILLSVLWLVVLFIVFLLIRSRVHLGGDAHFSNYLFILVVLFIVIFLLLVGTIGFIKFPKGVSISNSTHSITLSYLFGNEVSISLEQIEAFSTGYLYIRRDPVRYKLIQVILTDGKNQVLTEFDLSEIDSVRDFLNDNEVLNLGEAKFSYIKYVFGI